MSGYETPRNSVPQSNTLGRTDDGTIDSERGFRCHQGFPARLTGLEPGQFTLRYLQPARQVITPLSRGTLVNELRIYRFVIATTIAVLVSCFA